MTRLTNGAAASHGGGSAWARRYKDPQGPWQRKASPPLPAPEAQGRLSHYSQQLSSPFGATHTVCLLGWKLLEAVSSPVASCPPALGRGVSTPAVTVAATEPVLGHRVRRQRAPFTAGTE